MRCLAAAPVAALALLAGCAELGVVSDGTSISVGRPSRGRIVDGVRLPDSGEGFFTREVWATRDQRYGTDELVDLLIAVSRRMVPRAGGTRLVIADLSGHGGGPAFAWHRSHQSGRDADLLYFMRDKQGQPMEADAMHVFDRNGVARDGSGITIDVPKTWLLVKELVTAPEAPVQWVFMYEPIAARLIAHAEEAGEPEAVIARVRQALKQPGDSARHDDHLHVRVYCSKTDRAYGCVDAGPMELLAEHEAELQAADAIAATFAGTAGGTAPGTPPASGGGPAPSLESLGRALRTRSHWIDLRRWR
ncbi:MAG TPA: penicillin-insensitive murein endopeptidase [Kofleriaceae bacterium]|nr:penicillin-insensitive murein endopeptidase [Kofleriaceae bacterium]